MQYLDTNLKYRSYYNHSDQYQYWNRYRFFGIWIDTPAAIPGCNSAPSVLRGL